MLANGFKPYRRVSTADTNICTIKDAEGQIGWLHASNSGTGAAFVKLYDKAEDPVLAEDEPVFTFTVPAGGSLDLIPAGINPFFPTGIAMAITGSYEDDDDTTVTAGQVIVNSEYR